MRPIIAIKLCSLTPLLPPPPPVLVRQTSKVLLEHLKWGYINDQDYEKFFSSQNEIYELQNISLSAGETTFFWTKNLIL